MRKHISIVACCLLVFLACATAFAQKTARDFYDLSQKRLMERDLGGALAAIDKAIEIEPERAGLYARRSELRIMQGQLDDALADMDKALLIDPELAPLYSARGHLRMMKSDTKGALNDFDYAIARGDRSANVYGLRARLRMTFQDYTGALSDYNTAISMNPGRVGNYLGRAAARNLTGDKPGALTDYTYVIDTFEQKEREGTAPDKEARRARANDINSPMIRGPEVSKSGDSKVTTRTAMVATMNPELEDTMSAEQMEYLPNVAAAYMNRSRMRSNNGDSDAALEDLNKSLAVFPQFVGYEARGKLLQKRGDLSASLADLNKSIELQPGMALAYLERGETLLLMGKDEEAEKDFSRCLELSPEMDKMVADARIAAKSRKQEKP